MKFEAYFYCIMGKSLVDEVLSAPGLDMLDDIRENLGKNIPMTALDITCPFYGRNYSISLTEKEARHIPYLKQNVKIKIRVPEGYFSRYLIYESIWNYNKCSCFDWISKLKYALTSNPAKNARIEVKTVINQDQIIKDWIADGSPVRWGFEEDE